MNIIKLISIVYVIYAGSVILHEVGHLIAAKIFYKEYEEICIGNLMHVKISPKIKISPVIFSGYISVQEETVLDSSKIKAIIFFSVGFVVNFIQVIIGISFNKYSDIFALIAIINMIQCINSVIPIEGSDGYNLIRIMIYKFKYD